MNEKTFLRSFYYQLLPYNTSNNKIYSSRSSLVLRFIKGTFRESYIPTIEDTYRQVIRMEIKRKLSEEFLIRHDIYFHVIPRNKVFPSN